MCVFWGITLRLNQLMRKLQVVLRIIIGTICVDNDLPARLSVGDHYLCVWVCVCK